MLGLAAALVAPAGIAGAQEGSILVVSRKRLLNETSHARLLRKAEIELTAKLQAKVDAIKSELTAEEQELARLRPTLEREVFEARVAAFDRKVRTQRRETQKKAAALQNAFRAERLKLVEALQPLLDEIRRARGASVILNADQLLALDPTLDITDEAIALFDETVPAPRIPDLAAVTQAAPSDTPDSTEGAASGQ